MSTSRALSRLLRGAVRSVLRSASAAEPVGSGSTDGDGSPRRGPADARRAGRGAPTDRRATGAYAGDHAGPVDAEYAPDLDGDADPGEIVWAWVPYEEDPRRGKDRPVLVVGRDDGLLLGLMLSTRDHDVRPGRPGEQWLDLGTGAWDAERRASEVRLDRVLRLDPGAVRREGAVLDRRRFDQVAESLGRRPGW